MAEFNLAGTKEALARLRAGFPKVFGADGHQFELNGVVLEADLVAFERKYRISLPHDYRQFLTHLGNGGAGPFYGVFPLGMADDNFELRDWQERDNLVGILSEPFPFQEQWNDISPMPPEETYWGTALVNGAIPICHEGCALRIWLVVTGDQAGFLWEDKRAEYGGLTPLRLANGPFATFAAWYEDWINACLAELGEGPTLPPRSAT
jgi:SMI1 / KNR4 family (SUKH-1)